jgi:hypothetical protein
MANEGFADDPWWEAREWFCGLNGRMMDRERGARLLLSGDCLHPDAVLVLQAIATSSRLMDGAEFVNRLVRYTIVLTSSRPVRASRTDHVIFFLCGYDHHVGGLLVYEPAVAYRAMLHGDKGTLGWAQRMRAMGDPILADWEFGATRSGEALAFGARYGQIQCMEHLCNLQPVTSPRFWELRVRVDAIRWPTNFPSTYQTLSGNREVAYAKGKAFLRYAPQLWHSSRFLRDAITDYIECEYHTTPRCIDVSVLCMKRLGVPRDVRQLLARALWLNRMFWMK